MQYVTASSVNVKLVLPAGVATSYSWDKVHLTVKSGGNKSIINLASAGTSPAFTVKNSTAGTPAVINATTGAIITAAVAGVEGYITFNVPCSTDGMYYCTFSSTPGSTDLDAAVVPYDTLGSVMFNRVTPTATVLK